MFNGILTGMGDFYRDLILASRSPRRTALLRMIGVSHTVQEPVGEEVFESHDVIDEAPEGIPVIVAMNAERGYVFEEFEEEVDAIFLGFDVDYRSFLPLVLGSVEPSGLLPIQMPIDMVAVEAQHEDVPRDMECYEDAMGHIYDFAFGLNWSGIIRDERTEKYDVPALLAPKK